MSIKIVKTGDEAVRDVEFHEGITLGEALGETETESFETLVNGDDGYYTDDELEDGDEIELVPEDIDGGR